MIKRTIVLTIILLCAYSLFLSILYPSLQMPYNQWQLNNLKAEKYLYSNTTSENIIVGTSLSNRLIMDSLADCSNLSFSDLSIIEGLKIILKKNIMPKRVFIETNIVFKKENNDFTDALFNPVSYNLKKMMPSLRDGKQPVFIVYSRSLRLLIMVEDGIKKWLGKDTRKSASANNTFEVAIASTLKYFSAKPGKAERDSTFSNLDYYVRKLMSRGVKVIFFELPVNCRITKSPLHQIVRKTFLDRYTPDKFVYLPTPDCIHYKTSDGIHFTFDDALKYTSFFKTEMDKLK